jgi:hypothetical protein
MTFPHLSRRAAVKLGAAFPLALALPGLSLLPNEGIASDAPFLKVRDKVPDPENVFFEVQYPGKAHSSSPGISGSMPTR